MSGKPVVVRCASAVVEHVMFVDAHRAWFEFLSLCNGIPGLTVLTSTMFEFPGGGFSGVVTIAESHAAIHTWPERQRAWIELATCGQASAIHEFIDRVEARWAVVDGWQRTVGADI